MLTELHGAIAHLIAWLGAGGPWMFFGAMALLPCIGVPMTTFSLTAGTIFRDQLGIGGVVAAAVAATMANIALTYWLARGALRPVLRNLVEKRGHRLPEVESGDAKDLIVLVRVSPAPFFIKNYLLGLADVPLAPYFVISFVVEGFYTAGFTVFGDALLHGEGGKIVIGATVLVVAIAGTHFVRRHYGKKRKPARVHR
ncbi:MAG TPA: VTT domain-containing protein [Opitutaceae bacterium]|jgi:uncharacterized membrane protein YdjX (TVP38/TMEM64 family)